MVNQPIPVKILGAETQHRAPSRGQDQVIVVPDTVGDRYATFHFISWWDQARVRAATVMVVGAGALGNEVLKNLALVGVGRILIADFDWVEPGNLSRAVLFRASDSKRSKAEAAAEAVRGLNPDVQTQAFHGDVNVALGLGVFRRMDVIIGCLDNREARLTLNKSAYQLNRPWIDGAIQELLGVARVFAPGRGACYECTLTPADWELINLRYSCTLLSRERLLEGKVPTTPTIASIIGAIQAQDALKLLHGMDVEAGKGFIFNGLTNQAYAVTYPQREDCLNHETVAPVIEELPQARAETITLAEMLAIAQARLGERAHLELDYELVVEFLCANCGNRAEVFAPMRRLTGKDAQCPVCGVQRQALTTHAITGSEPFLERTLAQVGVPPLHIITARHGRQFAHFELTGDAASWFQWS